MKSAFTFNGQHYISPSKKEAKRFLKTFGDRAPVYRYRTGWKLKHVERAPSYFKSMRISSPVNYFVDI